ncbi:MAG TPA: DMT family transporter [Burkholderiaceae bacterium]|nr:DMT family transporter [Burkholderiaceae bacterium]
MSALGAIAPAHAGRAARRQRWALWAALATVAVWGANFSIQKAVYEAVTPAGFLLVRYLVMPVCAVALLAWRYGARWPRLPRADLVRLAWLGFWGHFVHVGMVTAGIHWSTAFSSSLILACGPIYTLLILRWFGIERLGGAQVSGVAVALAGVLVFLSDKLLSGRWGASAGDLFLLLAASLFSYYTVAAKPMIERHGGVVVMTYALLAASPLVVVATLPLARDVDWDAVSALQWSGVLWSTIVSAFLGWLVWGWVNTVRGVGRTAPLMYLMPPVAGVVAWWITDERFTGIKLAGAALTLAGVALAQFAGRPPAPVREAPPPTD